MKSCEKSQCRGNFIVSPCMVFLNHSAFARKYGWMLINAVNGTYYIFFWVNDCSVVWVMHVLDILYQCNHMSRIIAWSHTASKETKALIVCVLQLFRTAWMWPAILLCSQLFVVMQNMMLGNISLLQVRPIQNLSRYRKHEFHVILIFVCLQNTSKNIETPWALLHSLFW